MSASDGHPHKTELGLDELRHRTRGLSQRHRTMLLLVNGKRTRAEVLTLAGQAGVGADFFDELVVMGMVEAAPPPPAPTPRPVLLPEAAPQKAVPVVAPSPVPVPVPSPTAVVRGAGASGPPRPRRAAPPVLTLDHAVPLEATRAAPRPAVTVAVAQVSPPLGRPSEAAKIRPNAKAGVTESARVKFTAVVHKPKAATVRRAPPVELRQEPHLTPVQPPARSARIKMLAPVGPVDEHSEMQLLAEVRSLLIGTLLADGPVSHSLTALRVRKANSRFDLTALVWEIERTLVQAKRPHDSQRRLTQARDLLGLGNTVVDEDASPGVPRAR